MTRVIRYSSQPASSPLLLTIVAWLLLDRLGSPGWLYGVAFSILGILWISFLVRFFTEKIGTPIFKEDVR